MNQKFHKHYNDELILYKNLYKISVIDCQEWIIFLNKINQIDLTKYFKLTKIFFEKSNN